MAKAVQGLFTKYVHRYNCCSDKLSAKQTSLTSDVAIVICRHQAGLENFLLRKCRGLWHFLLSFSCHATRVARWFICIPKNPNFGKFWKSFEPKIFVYFMYLCKYVWNILRSVGILYGHLVCFLVIWYIFQVLVSFTEKNLAIWHATKMFHVSYFMYTVLNWSLVASGFISDTGLPDFSCFNIPKQGNIYQITNKLPSGHKIYQMAEIYS
jgi:hypothetical protein